MERFLRKLTPFYDKYKSWLKKCPPPPHTYSLRGCSTPPTFENWWKVMAMYPMIFLLFSLNHSLYRIIYIRQMDNICTWMFKWSNQESSSLIIVLIFTGAMLWQWQWLSTILLLCSPSERQTSHRMRKWDLHPIWRPRWK